MRCDARARPASVLADAARRGDLPPAPLSRPGDVAAADAAEADRASEALLRDGLRSLLPDTRIVGEENCAWDPSLLDELDRGRVWLVDPLDGTSNFRRGRTPFAMLVALLDGGDTQAAWLLDPCRDRLCHAALGQGAFVDGTRVRSRGTGAAIPLGALGTTYLPAELGRQCDERAEGRIARAPLPRCTGEQYPRLVLGEEDVALYWRPRPWDHAAGALFLREAGGWVAHFDGSPYHPGRTRNGLLAASSRGLWEHAARILFG